MSFLAASDVVDLAAEHASLLPHAAVLLRRTAVRHEGGVVRETPVVVRRDVPCRVARAAGGAAGAWRVTFAGDASLDDGTGHGTAVSRLVVAIGTETDTPLLLVLAVAHVDRPAVAAARVLWADAVREPDTAAAAADTASGA